MKLVDQKRIVINKIADLKSSELTELSKKLGIFNHKKTGEMMRIDLINLSKILLGGQVKKQS